MQRVLDGIRVLDFSRWAAGPSCGMLLADMGAEVIRIEPPGGSEDRLLAPFTPTGECVGLSICLSRNKKGITLDLRNEKSGEIVKELIKKSDVVLENFPGDAAKAMGLEYQSLKDVNPGIIWVSISGFGKYGPYREKTAFDTVAQAMSGAMSFTGFPETPPTRSGVAWVDYVTGTYAALGTMFALFHRQRTGVGQMVDLAMMDVAVSLVAGQAVASEYRFSGKPRERIGNHSFYNPTDCFKTSDGWVMISVLGDSMWRRFMRLIGREDLLSDPRLSDDVARYENRDIVTPIISGWTEQRTTDEVVRLLEEKRLPCGRVNNIAEVMVDPQVIAREMIVDVEQPGIGKVPMGGMPIKLSETPGRIEAHAPSPGEHNEEIYYGLLGYDEAKLGKLKEEGVI